MLGRRIVGYDNKTWQKGTKARAAGMDREEILAQSRQDNRFHDERECRIADQASVWGAIGMASVLIVVFVIRLAVTGDDPYDLLAMGFGYLAAAQAYKWHTTKAVSALLMATLCLAISLGWLWFYALEG